MNEIEEGTIEMIEGPELDRIQELEEELAGTIATKHNDDAKIKKLEEENRVLLRLETKKGTVGSIVGSNNPGGFSSIPGRNKKNEWE